MKKGYIFAGLLEVLFIGVYFYLFLPAINPTSLGFWGFVLVSLIVAGILFSIASSVNNTVIIKKKGGNEFPLSAVIPFMLAVFVIAGVMIVDLICSPIFNAKSYSTRISIDQSNEFLNDIAPVDFKTLPLLDRNSSEKLGDRVMGQMSELVSQFYVSDQYTQINYNNDIVRVTPLEYADIIKWFTNRDKGVTGYITVNSVNGEAELKKLDKGMKYMPSAFFNENLYRVLRFKYPTTNLGEAKFEIDNEGKPFWIVPTYSYTGINLKTRVTGAIILDPVTGDSTKYDIDDVPPWVDNAYDAELIIEQVDDWGNYNQGFLNSIFAQKNVVNTTEGYNYLAMNDDVYLYTGITSVLSDESNLGFILSNMRTGETKFYSVAGAEEYSAMNSAMGQVQQMNYTSTFPLLINLNNKPTYLVSLKDAAGLVKMYGFIDVADYQKVVVTDASKGINAAAENYLNSYAEEMSDDLLKKDIITISSIETATKSGNTYYYITDKNKKRYIASIALSDMLPFTKSGDQLSIGYYMLPMTDCNTSEIINPDGSGEIIPPSTDCITSEPTIIEIVKIY